MRVCYKDPFLTDKWAITDNQHGRIQVKLPKSLNRNRKQILPHNTFLLFVVVFFLLLYQVLNALDVTYSMQLKVFTLKVSVTMRNVCVSWTPICNYLTRYVHFFFSLELQALSIVTVSMRTVKRSNSSLSHVSPGDIHTIKVSVVFVSYFFL